MFQQGGTNREHASQDTFYFAAIRCGLRSNRHATVLVRTHPADIASSISVNADDEAREIGATLLLQIDHRVSTSLHRENEVVGIEGISFLFPLAIRQGRR